MGVIGKELRNARERRGLELSDVAAELEIPTKDLRAIEWDRFDLLPPGDAVRTSLRAYARFVEVDPDRLLALYDAADLPADVPPEPPAPAAQPEPDAASPAARAEDQAVAADRRAPADITLAAASRSLDVAVVQAAGARQLLEGLDANEQGLGGAEVVRFWAFAQRMQEAARRMQAEGDKLAQRLLERFVGGEGDWPLSTEQKREYHEVRAALLAQEAERHRQELGRERDGEAGGAEADDSG